jgi:hypothetical protein
MEGLNVVMPVSPSSPRHLLVSRVLVITRLPPAVSAQVTGGPALPLYRKFLSSAVGWLTRPSRRPIQFPQSCLGPRCRLGRLQLQSLIQCLI